MPQDPDLRSYLEGAWRQNPEITEDELVSLATQYRQSESAQTPKWLRTLTVNPVSGFMQAAGTGARFLAETQRAIGVDAVNPFQVRAQQAVGEWLTENAPQPQEAGRFGQVMTGLGSTLALAPAALAGPLAAGAGATAGAASLVGGAAVASASIAVESGSEYYRSLERDPENYAAAWRSALIAAPPAAAEGLVLPKALKPMLGPLSKILGRVDGASGGSLMKAALRSVAGTMGGEYAQEYSQELASILNDHLADEDVGTFWDIVARANDAGVTGGLVGGILGGAAVGIGGIQEVRARAEQGKAATERILAATEAAGAPESAPAGPEPAAATEASREWRDYYGPPKAGSEAADVQVAKIGDEQLRDHVAELRKAGYEGAVDVVPASEVDGSSEVADLVDGLGLTVEYVRGEGVLPMAGSYRENRIILDATLAGPQQREAILAHEAGHHLRSVLVGQDMNPKAMLKLLGDLETAFPGLLERSGLKYEQRRSEALGESWVPLDEQAYWDEAFATLTENVPNALWNALQDPARMEALAQQPGILQRLVDWLLDLGSRLGLSESPSLRRLKEVVGQDPTGLEAELGAQRSAEIGAMLGQAFRELAGREGLASALKVGRVADPLGAVSGRPGLAELEERYAEPPSRADQGASAAKK